MVRGGFHLGSIWLFDSQGASQQNLAVLGAAAEQLALLRGPWVIGGDWNMPPHDLAATGWPDLVGGTIVAPELPTCNGKVYDYFSGLSSSGAVHRGRRLPPARPHQDGAARRRQAG